MEIMRVVSELVATRRIGGLASASLRVLADEKGKLSVAVDPVGVPPGKWVFTAGGSAARLGPRRRGRTQTDLAHSRPGTFMNSIDFAPSSRPLKLAAVVALSAAAWAAAGAHAEGVGGLGMEG